MKKPLLFIVFFFLLAVCVTAIQSLDIGGLDEKLKAIRQANLELMKAKYWQALDGKTVQCHLCPNFCVLENGRKGRCGDRINVDGTLYTLVYARPVAVHIDPIEKKPLSHFLPGTSAFSIATAGCNLGCLFCQNWQISQARPEDAPAMVLTPSEVVRLAKENNCASIAYTYTEPAVFYEYMLDTAKLAKAAGIRNVMHTCGYINEEPLKELLTYMDAVNVDLKGFTDDYYRQMCSGSLVPVLRTIKTVKKAGVWLEITNLVVPGRNDDPDTARKMCAWIKENAGPDTPVYFSAFMPMYRLTSVPPTPVKTLEDLREIARSEGLNYVYIGNVYGHIGADTYCPKCGKLIVKRQGFDTLENDVVDGKCRFCGERIAGVWQ